MRILAAVFFALAFVCNAFADIAIPRGSAGADACALLRGFCPQNANPQIGAGERCQAFASAKKAPLPGLESGNAGKHGKSSQADGAKIYAFAVFCGKPQREKKIKQNNLGFFAASPRDFLAAYSIFLI